VKHPRHAPASVSREQTRVQRPQQQQQQPQPQRAKEEALGEEQDEQQDPALRFYRDFCKQQYTSQCNYPTPRLNLDRRYAAHVCLAGAAAEAGKEAVADCDKANELSGARAIAMCKSGSSSAEAPNSEYAERTQIRYRAFDVHVRRYELTYGVELRASNDFWLGVSNGLFYAHPLLAKYETFAEPVHKVVREFQFSDAEAVAPYLHPLEDLVTHYKAATSERGREALARLIGEDLASTLVQSGASQRFVHAFMHARALENVMQSLSAEQARLAWARKSLLTCRPPLAFEDTNV
jgi:hypothetical protein